MFCNCSRIFFHKIIICCSRNGALKHRYCRCSNLFHKNKHLSQHLSYSSKKTVSIHNANAEVTNNAINTELLSTLRCEDESKDDLLDEDLLEEIRKKAGGMSSRLIKLIRCEGDLDRNAIISILQYYESTSMGNKKLSESRMSYFLSSKEYSDFIKALELYIPELDSNNLIIGLCFCLHFDVPHNSSIYNLIISKLMKNINSVSFKNAVLTSLEFQHTTKNSIFNELKEQLRCRIELKLEEDFAKLSLLDLLTTMQYVAQCNIQLADNLMVKMLKTALAVDEKIWLHKKAFLFFYKILHKLNVDYFQMKILKSSFFKKLYKCLANKNFPVLNFTFFLAYYQKLVRENLEEYDSKLINNVTDAIMKQDIPMFRILSSLGKTLEGLRHIRLDVAEAMVMQVMRDPWVLKRNEEFLNNFVVTMVDSGYSEILKKTQPDLLLDLRKVLENKSAFTKFGKKEVVALLKTSVGLALLNIFPFKELKKINEVVDENLFKELSTTAYLYLILYQELVIFYPSLFHSYRNDDLLACAFATIYTEQPIPKNLKVFVEDVSQSLNSILPHQNCMLLNQKTKFGHSVNLVLAMNKHGQFWDFTEIIKKDLSIYIEDISPPQGYKLQLLLTLVDSHYSRNTFNLKLVAVTRLKTLQKMGFITNFILWDEWKSLTEEEKIQFLRRKLQI